METEDGLDSTTLFDRGKGGRDLGTEEVPRLDLEPGLGHPGSLVGVDGMSVADFNGELDLATTQMHHVVFQISGWIAMVCRRGISGRYLPNGATWNPRVPWFGDLKAQQHPVYTQQQQTHLLDGIGVQHAFGVAGLATLGVPEVEGLALVATNHTATGRTPLNCLGISFMRPDGPFATRPTFNRQGDPVGV